MGHQKEMKTKPLKVEQMEVARINMRATNPRTHSDEQVAQIAASIREFGFVNALLLDKDLVLIAGHGRLAAAMRLGLDTVPAIVLSDLTPAQCQALVIADNKLALNAGWEPMLLAAEIREISDLREVDLSVLGFAPYELEAVLAGSYVEPKPEPIPEKDPEDPRARIRVTVDREDEAHARDVIVAALSSAGLTYDVK